MVLVTGNGINNVALVFVLVDGNGPEKSYLVVICISTFVFFYFLRAYLFVLAPLSETSEGVGKIRPSRSQCRRFGRDPCSVSRVASLSNVFGLGHI